MENLTQCGSSTQYVQKNEEREGPVQGRLYRSTKLWLFYCDLEESLGTLESTRAVYDKILELRIATPQVILNYALFLQVSFLSITGSQPRSFVWISTILCVC